MTDPRDRISCVRGRAAAIATVIAFWVLASAGSAPQQKPVPPRDPTLPTAVSGAQRQAPTVKTQTPRTQPAQASTRSPRNASYTITARLDPASRTLKGEELLTWRNIASIPATTLRFHLHYNAWRNTRSSWMREQILSGDADVEDREPEDWGWIDITSLKLVGTGGAPVDVTSSLRFIAPDDGNAEDRTLAEIPLATPVGPGETVNVQIAWSSRIPRTFARTGAIGNFYFIAQWFPKIAVLEDSGWNSHQFHAATEFFADFGIYDVRLTVPTGWIVGATGIERGRRDEGDRTTTHHYYAEDVHDFAWTTSPAFLERTERFGHPSLPAVTMRLLVQPEHWHQADRHFQATRAALKYYGEWFGPYPYPNITIVDPAWQSGAGGMEYPTLITAGTSWIAPRYLAEPEDVVVHETGHQFWYGIVATNEVEHAWMDEGIDTYATARTLDQFFRPQYFSKRYFGGFIPWVFDDLPLRRESDGNLLAHYRAARSLDPQSLPTWRYWPGTSGVVTYAKTSLWLHTLERMLGWETVQRILSTFFTRYAYRHPKPQDFFAVANEVSGRDLTWFFDQVYRSSGTFDYKVDVFESEEVLDRGYFGDASGRVSTELSANVYRTTVVVRREGEGIFPVDVRVVFEDKQEVRWHWDGRDRWKLYEIDRPARAVAAQVDPERVLLLDVNYTNNSRTLHPQARAAARKWSLAWLIWLQDHLLTYGFFI
jgi:hypothetical protein